MPQKKLSATLQSLLPGEPNKRIRQAILAAAQSGSAAARSVKAQIDVQNRLKTGRLVEGSVSFTSTTSATLSGFAWVINYAIQQPTTASALTVLAPDANFPRPDAFIGKSDGSIEYRAGTVDQEGNAIDPSYNALTEVLLVAVTRNPDGSNVQGNTSSGSSDFVSKSAQGNQTIQSDFTLAKLADSANPSNLIQLDTNGKLMIVRADRIGAFATRNLDTGFSRLARIHTVISGGPVIRDYQFKLDILAALDNDVTQQGELYCALINDGTGTYVSSVLQVTGSLSAAVFKLVKVSATEYDLFYQHLDNTAILIYRPFALGPANRYTFYRQETILASLPAGDQYGFVSSAQGAGIQDIIAGSNITIDKTDPANPIISSTGGGGGGSIPYLTDLDTWPTLKFDKNYRYTHEMSGAVTILAELVTPLAVVGNLCKLYIKANGADKPDFEDEKFEIIWDNWVNTSGHWNRFFAEYSPEGKVILQIEQAHLGTANDGSGLTQLTITFEDNHVQTHIITNSTEIVIDSTGAQVGYKTILYVKADGTNKPFWDSVDVVVTYDDYLNVADVWNRIILEWRPESKAIMQLINT